MFESGSSYHPVSLAGHDTMLRKYRCWRDSPEGSCAIMLRPKGAKNKPYNHRWEDKNVRKNRGRVRWV